MTDDKLTLIELYKSTLEELRDKQRLYAQWFTGLFTVTPIFLAAISFFLGTDSPIQPAYICYFKVSIYILYVIFIIIFWITIWGINRRVNVCHTVSIKIETELKKMSTTYDLDGLLIRKELDKPSFYSKYAHVTSYVYAVLSAITLILVGLALFCWINI